MGIFNKLARAVKTGTEEEKSPDSGIRKKVATVYRTAPFNIHNDATRVDLANVLEGLVKQKVITKKVAGDFLNATRDELAMKLEDLVRRGAVAREEVEFYMEGIIGETREKIKAAGEAGRSLGYTEKEKLLATVKARFEKHNKYPKFKKARKGIEWPKVQDKLEASPDKMWSLNEMERTGGKPDVVGYDKETGEYIFMDCSHESPKKRRNICFNRYGQEMAESERRKPKGNAVDMAEKMGIKILKEKEYIDLQFITACDDITESWVVPDDVSDDEMKTAGFARTGERGGCDGCDIYTRSLHAAHYFGHVAFRGSLRV